MRTGRIVAIASAVTLSLSFAALAGVPLKGVDVKLGKNPGGSCAARTTDAAGKANFGVWSAGNYNITFGPPPTSAPSANATAKATARTSAPPIPTRMHLVITGAAGGKIERDLGAGAGESSARATPINFAMNGKDELIVVVSNQN